MNILKANTSQGGRFTTQSADGVLTNAASTPTAGLYANGSVISAVTVTITNITTGIYTYSYTTPADISSYLGQKVQVQILATVGTSAGGCVIDEGYFDTVIGSEINTNVSSRLASSAITLNSGKVTVVTNEDKTGYALTQSFPTNFSSLLINSSGHISRVTLVDTTTTNTDMRGTNGAITSLTGIATATNISDLRTHGDNNWVTAEDVNVVAINSSTSAAEKLEKSANAIILGTVLSGAGVHVIPTDLSITLDNVLINRTLIVLTGSSQGEATTITAYDADLKVLTVEDITQALSEGDTFAIV